jgi:hypothetical protein
MNCSIPNCGKPVNCKGMCKMHYMRVHRNGDPGGAQPTKDSQPFVPNRHIRFTPKLWRKWLSTRTPDKHTLRLREGIHDMRRALETKTA